MHNSSSTRPTFTFDAPVPVRNLGVRLAIDPHLSFSSHISNLSRSCFMHIRDLHRIRPMLDFKAASSIATSIVHSKLDYRPTTTSSFSISTPPKYSVCSLSKTHLHGLLPERPGVIN